MENKIFEGSGEPQSEQQTQWQQTGQQPQAHWQQGGQQYGQQQWQRQVCPDTYLLWAILTTCLCCLPFGIYAIIKASQVENLFNMGNYEAALKASNEAKKWSIISAVAGIVTTVLYVLLVVIMALCGENIEKYIL